VVVMEGGWVGWGRIGFVCVCVRVRVSFEKDVENGG
jgi:hypothetical protein